MNRQYSYPLELTWNHDEIATVMRLWQLVEQAYASKISCESFQTAYRNFKEVVPSIGEEKRLGREFEQASGYSLYQVKQKANTQKTGNFKMIGKR